MRFRRNVFWFHEWLGERCFQGFYFRFQCSIRSVIEVPVASEATSFTARFFLQFWNLLRSMLVLISPWSKESGRIGKKYINKVGFVWIIVTQNGSGGIECNWMHQFFIRQNGCWFSIVGGGWWKNWDLLICVNDAVGQNHECRYWFRQCFTAMRFHFCYGNTELWFKVAKAFIIGTFRY